MSRRSLRPELNKIRGWVRQGRTDAWIAHQLEVTVQQIQAFKREHDLEPDGESTNGAYEEVDLRAEDDAAIAAELEAEEARRAEEEARRRAREEEEAEEARRRAEEEDAHAEEAARRAAEAEEAEREEGEGDEEEARPRRRRRGGRGRRRAAGSATTLEGTFDHGEEGYGLWLDPAVQDDPVYAEHWAGHRPVTVTIDEDQIVIRRAGADEDDD
jgi:flagellar biosynthesis GTPase FlhF